MAINVNKVYKKVLSIINKEQRGFITPDEFNKYATNAQLQLLDIAFSDFTSVSNLDTAMRTNMGYADIPSKIKEKIDVFYKTSTLTSAVDSNNNPTGVYTLPVDIYKIIDLTNGTRTLPFELVDKHELPYLLSSPLTAPSTDYPIYYKTTTLAGATSIQVNPSSIGTAVIDYIKVPSDPRFGYTVNATYGTNTYDDTVYNNSMANTTQGSTDFELHPSEEPALTTSILMLAGISMKDREIVSLSGQAIQANAVAKKL
jgi:hypothetical protein